MSQRCPTRLYFEARPTDLITWNQAAAAVACSPHPMSARNLRRLCLEAGLRTYAVPGVRGEHVSRTAVFDFHRDYWNGWTTLRPPTGKPRGRRAVAVR